MYLRDKDDLKRPFIQNRISSLIIRIIQDQSSSRIQLYTEVRSRTCFFQQIQDNNRWYLGTVEEMIQANDVEIGVQVVIISRPVQKLCFLEPNGNKRGFQLADADVNLKTIRVNQQYETEIARVIEKQVEIQ